MRDIIEQFIFQIEDDQKFSQNTKSAYKSDLNELIDYVIKTNTQLSDLDHNWVKKYLKHLEEMSREKNSYNRKASTFRIFLKYLYIKNLAQTNYSLIVNNQTAFLKSNLEDELQVQDVEQILNNIELRLDRRLILLLISEIGIPATQLVSLNTFQVDFENRAILLSDSEKIKLPEETFLALREYLINFRETLPGANENLSIFLNEKGKPLAESDIYFLMKDIDIRLGLGGKLNLRNLKKLAEKKNKTDILSIQRQVLNVITPSGRDIACNVSTEE